MSDTTNAFINRSLIQRSTLVSSCPFSQSSNNDYNELYVTIIIDHVFKWGGTIQQTHS